MAFFKVNAEEAAKAPEGGNYINQSGVYPVTIKAVIVDYNDSGARSLNFFVDNNGTEQVIYGGLKLDNNDGTPNFQAPIFNKLCVIAQLDDVADPEEATLPIGKEGADKDVAVLPDFQDIEVQMWVQMEYTIYNGSIKEKKIIKGFYAPDGTSADEIINETESGVRFNKDSKYHSNTTYKDGLDEEKVQTWISAGRPEGTGGSTVTKPKASFGAKQGADKPKPAFGKKA